MKRELILGVDVGTSSVKIGIFDKDLNCLKEGKHGHQYESFGQCVEIHPEVLFHSFLEALKELGEYLPEVVAMGFSVLCPNMICMDEEGKALRPGIIHLDRRSMSQGLEIKEKVGLEDFQKVGGNVPCPGGVSVTSMLWVKQNEPEIYEKTVTLGHTNTYFVKKMTGNLAVDPTNASFMGLYNSFTYGKEWDADLCEKIGIDSKKLPPIVYSWETAGYITKEMAALTGLNEGIPVIMGGADTACSTYGAGCVDDGDLMNSTGTVEVMVLSTERPVYSDITLLRTHVIPNRWIMMNIIGAGGESLNWFYNNFCQDMDKDTFFAKYLPEALEKFEDTTVSFTPHLAGDRTCVEDKQAIISGLTLSSKREDVLAAVVKGIVKQLSDGMELYKDVSGKNLSDLIKYTGGGSGSLMKYKEKVFSEFSFTQVDNCAMIGIATLVRNAYFNR